MLAWAGGVAGTALATAQYAPGSVRADGTYDSPALIWQPEGDAAHRTNPPLLTQAPKVTTSTLAVDDWSLLFIFLSSLRFEGGGGGNDREQTRGHDESQGRARFDGGRYHTGTECGRNFGHLDAICHAKIGDVIMSFSALPEKIPRGVF